MNNYIFYGSKKWFEDKIPDEYMTLTELVMESDESRRVLRIDNVKNKETEPKKKIDNLVIWSEEYSGVREHVILNFANFVNEFDVANIYYQNPPIQISSQICNLYADTSIEYQKYRKISEDIVIRIRDTYDEVIIGQNNVKNQLLKSLLPLTFSERHKPVVLLFYGISGIGKTETAYFIANSLEEKIFRKQFSMFQNDRFSTYLFGGMHYEKSFAKELLDRESNILLFDEFDKAHPLFHSAFYQLFDEGIFRDPNYSVKLEGSVIVCTSNYKDKVEIHKSLGDALYNRFDAIIGFDALSSAAKKEIGERYILDISKRYLDNKNYILGNDMKCLLINSLDNCNSAREIKRLIEDFYSLNYIKNL